ncbi:hypothetical protein KKF61_01685 [Patescibacteria group bacterium]|nr:hypothetical protein [Patescibacteria group bacterium]MBU0964310.1 hypothetical protein [Patescibacteria group bacterium]
MRIKSTTGSIYIPVLIIITLFVSLSTLALTYVVSRAKLSNQEKFREISFQIAEAGIEYYRWHLAHDRDDFQDGTGAPGPYVHEYSDADGSVLGQFSLDITPPPVGSTVATIESSGSTTEKPNLKKIISAVLGRPSFTNFAVVANDNMRFGEGTEVYGPIHSNYGIRFDGLAHNVVSSSEIDYNDPDHGGGNEWAVHTHLSPTDPLPPTAMPSRPDVFEVGREVDVGGVSFTSISGEFDDLQAEAAANGIYLTDSNAEGYRVHFRTDHKVEIYRVTGQQTCQKYTCFWTWCWWTNYSSTNLWSVGTEETFNYGGESSDNLNMPTNGLIFIEDDVWVDGQINGDRVTVVAAKTPYSSGNANIINNNDLLYTNYDGTDAIGLLAQDNVYAGFFSEDDLRVDAALIAQKGRVGRLYYPSASGDFNPAGCNQNYSRDTFTNFGAIGTNERYGYAWTGSSYTCDDGHTQGSGYCTRNLLYDDEFYFSPPPFFPATDQFRIITWEEVD